VGSLPLVIWAAWLLACGGQSAAPDATVAAPGIAIAADIATTPDTATTAEAATTATAAPQEVLSLNADSAELSQCKAIVSKSWTAVKPVIGSLGVMTDAPFESLYRNDLGFLDACVGLPQNLRDCLTLADNPVLGIETCKINEPTPLIKAFDIGAHVELWPSQPLSAEDAAVLTAQLQGTWLMRWDKGQQQQRWVIGPGGKVTSAELTIRGKVDPNALVPEELSFKQTRKLGVRWKGTDTTQSFAFFMVDKDTFFASGNGLYDAYPVADEAHFLVRHRREFVRYDAGRCDVILGTGLSLPATCSFKQDGDLRRFETTYQSPGQEPAQARPITFSHVLIGKHFIVDSMYESARFVRQKK